MVRVQRALTIVLAVLAVALSWRLFGPRPTAPPATPTPAYLEAKGNALFAASLRQFNPTLVPLRLYRGQPLVVYFWASWCVPCAEEAQALQRLYAKRRADGLVVLGIGVDQSDRIERFANDQQIDFPVFVGGAEGIALSKRLGNLRAEMPFAAAVDRQGRVVAVQLGKFKPDTPDALAAAALR